MTALPLPAALARSLTGQWLRLDNPHLWTGGLVVTLGIVTVFMLPALRRQSGLSVALAWVYAGWLSYLAIFNLLQNWYVVPLIGLVALVPYGCTIRRFALTLALVVEFEALFLVPTPLLEAWSPWSGLVAVLVSSVAFMRSPLGGSAAWRRSSWRDMRLGIIAPGHLAPGSAIRGPSPDTDMPATATSQPPL